MSSEPKKIKVFSNTKRKPTDPDLTGFVTVNDTKTQRISLWLNKAKNGEQYYSGYLNDINDETPKTGNN